MTENVLILALKMRNLPWCLVLVFMCYHINISNENTTSEAYYLNFSIIVVSREPLINQSINQAASFRTWRRG